jgi:hypothetical protein
MNLINQSRLRAPVLILLFMVLAACNLPRAAAPTPFEFPTPNLTLTSVFATAAAGSQAVSTLPGEAGTQPAATASATFLPTQPAPTATLAAPTLAPPTQSPAATLPPPSPTRQPPTATPASTRTPVSYAGPGARSGPSVEALYLEREPTLDGVFDDWDLDRYDASLAVYGGEARDGEDDLSSQFMVGWDEEALYIAARVFDDEYVQNAAGEDIFEGDSLEILLDTDVAGDFYLEALNGDDFQLGITPGSPAPGAATEAYLWFPTSEAGRAQGVKAIGSASDNGYRVETKIPWEVFGVRAQAGQHFGFAFSVSDNDRPGRNVQESMVSNIAGRVLTDPTTWGDLVLSGRSSSGNSPRPQTEARYLERAPNIDGSLGEWEISPVEIDAVVYGAEEWEGEADLSGRLVLGWDEDYLYIGVRVLDDQYAQNSRGEDIFLGDSLEILFDADLEGDAQVGSLNQDDYQVGISPGTELGMRNMGAYLWFPRGEAGAEAEVEVAAAPAGDGYLVEAAIPWSVFGLRPETGDRFGFLFSISDNDHPNREVQESMVAGLNRRVLTNPTTWGELVLRYSNR